MGFTSKKTVTLEIGGQTYQQVYNDTPDTVSHWSSDSIPAAKTGTLTTRTDNDTGTLTLQSSHGVTTGVKLDVYWGGGYRAAMTVGTVSGNSVPIDGGTGSNLPTATTAVTVMVHTPGAEEFSFTQAGLSALAAKMNGAAPKDFLITFYEADGTTVVTTIRGRGTEDAGVYQWTDDSGVTSPLDGANQVAEVTVTHADATAARTVNISTAASNS